mmetsp:Transcript_9292/g.16748  ORF Transcript_9292/g.16748 Transcript_9292/m.16748 type:complete len:286 (-) Transcript_9292:140-997(-)
MISGAHAVLPRVADERDCGPMQITPAPVPEACVSRMNACASRLADQEKERLRLLADITAVVREAMEMPSAQVINASSVDGRMIFVVDGATTSAAVDDLYDFLRQTGFRRTNYATPNNKEFKHAICEHPIEEVSNTSLFRAVMRLAQVCFPDMCPFVCHRVYTNSRLFGDVSFVHRDSTSPGTVTALVYPNPEWAAELGGETLFYDEQGAIVETAEPAPGRIVIFNGSIWHKGSPPGRLLLGPRYTTAFKLESQEALEQGSGASKQFDAQFRADEHQSRPKPMHGQ